MAIAKESFTSDGNTILTLKNKYSKNTVKGKTISLTNEESVLNVIELGENYIEISEVPLDYKIIIEYVIIGTLPTDNDTEYDLKQRIVELEKAVSNLMTIVEAQKLAINNRVSITSFRAWTSLIEKKTGITLVEGNLNSLNRELYNVRK